jgi:hypothetical protein
MSSKVNAATTEKQKELNASSAQGSKADTPTNNPSTKPKPKAPAKYAFHAIRIFDVVAIVLALFVILIARFLRPGFWSTLLYALAGVPAGLAMSFLYYKRKSDKLMRQQLVRICSPQLS